MRFEQVYYRNDEGRVCHLLLANPVETNVVGTDYVHGKECSTHGLKISAPRTYTDRHPEGDGVIWRLIPLASITKRVPMIHDGERLVRDDRSAPDPA